MKGINIREGETTESPNPKEDYFLTGLDAKTTSQKQIESVDDFKKQFLTQAELEDQ